MTLVKGCLNGAREPGEHPALPLTPAQLAAEARAAAAAGAGAVHVHPRGCDGRESLEATVIDAAVAAVREACPGLPVGVSTGAWIVPDADRRAAAIRAWREPDFASVNISERGFQGAMASLLEAGIGIEAGVWTVRDAEALAASGFGDRLVRVLVEPQDEAGDAAVVRAAAIDEALDAAGIGGPRLHHGYGPATWAVLRRAVPVGHDIRAGLEDSLVLPDGSAAAGNGELVAAATALLARG